MPGYGCGKPNLKGLEHFGKLAHWQGHFFNPLFFVLIMNRCYWVKGLSILDHTNAIIYSLIFWTLTVS